MTHAADQPTIAAVALDYARRGWKPIPVARKTKKPIGRGWDKRPFAPQQFNGNGQNVALQLGPPSAGLVDVDLDSTTAIGLAPEFLPATAAIFGRRSKPCSHQLYYSDLHETETRAAIEYKDATGAVIVELRIGAGGKAAATTAPPSMHVTGEMVQWVSDGPPARVIGEDLKRAVLQLAVACLLKPHYPGSGSRHDGALVLGGVLARARWSSEHIGHLVRVLAQAAGDDEVADRVATATGAIDVKANGHDVAGLTRFGELWGEKTAAVLAKWRLIAHATPKGGEKGAGLEDSVALAFAHQHVDDLRYVAKSSQWLRWAGERWQPEETLQAFDLSRTLCRQAGDSRSRTVAAVVALARTDRRMAATADQWDRGPMLLNARGSTIDLTTSATRPPARNDYCTKQTSATIAEPGTPAPLWSEFLDTVTGADEKLIGFLQRWAGYCLTGSTREHKLVFLYGPGGNGKGVFVGTLTALLGDYAITAPMEMFLASKHDRHPTEIARLKGARLVVAQETEKGRRWDETKLKILTSSDRLSGHFMRQDFFDFDPTHKLMITGNHKPALSAVDEAMRRRLLLVPFSVAISPEERDPNLPAKLTAEYPAILRWMVDGCLEWQREGLGVPDRVQKASDAYFANQDVLEQWIEDCTVDLRSNHAAFTTTRTLFTSWKTWCEARNTPVGTERAFADNLSEKGYDPYRKQYGRGFKGLELRAHDGPRLA
jgi:P4 family phage/plasmid primase-like protien